jgi:hypothetical protein
MPATFRRWLTDTWERVASTFAASFVVWLTAFDSFDPDAHWLRGLVAACIPPVLVVVMQAIPQLRYDGPQWWIDALVRIARSGAQGFLGALIASATLFDVTTWQAAGIAGWMAMLAALKTIAASWKTGTVTPASLARPRSST